MTEYWVSQSKYYCKFCKQWMADNKATRQLHDLGEKHKSQVEYFHKKKRDDKLHGARSERDLKQQMEAINKAAHAAVATDLEENAGLFYSTSQRHQHQFAPPPPPPMQHLNSPAEYTMKAPVPLANQTATAANLSESTDKAISENLRADNSGIYTVGDVTYLEGQYHEDQLVTDAMCEVFVESEDDWCKAKLIKSRVVAIAHTKLEMKSFDISYVPSSFEEWNETDAVVELEVKSDRLRMILGPPVVEEAKIVESTGFGVWETVSVRVIDEVEDEKAALEIAEQEAVKKAQAAERQERFESSAHSDNAMSSFDVYNTGTYKGVTFSKSEASSRKIAEEMESVANGKDVNFKKRKGKSIKQEGIKSRRRIIRKKTDEDED